jgi:hypothetical protein
MGRSESRHDTQGEFPARFYPAPAGKGSRLPRILVHVSH